MSGILVACLMKAKPRPVRPTSRRTTSSSWRRTTSIGDGEIGVIDHERARLGLVDARMEEIAEEGGIKGALAEVAHKILDVFDNDSDDDDKDDDDKDDDDEASQVDQPTT